MTVDKLSYTQHHRSFPQSTMSKISETQKKTQHVIPHRENLKIHLKINLLEMRGVVTLREKGGKYWGGGGCDGQLPRLLVDSGFFDPLTAESSCDNALSCTTYDFSFFLCACYALTGLF